MLKVIGTVEGVVTNVKTGEVVRKLPMSQNHVQDWVLQNFEMSGNKIRHRIKDRLFISTYNPGRQRKDLPADLTEGFSFGSIDINGVAPKEFIGYNEENNHLIRFTQRFAPPAEDITINSVGVCEYVSSTGNGVVKNLSNFVWLEEPCIQTTEEQLDLYYRVLIYFEPYNKEVSNRSRSLTPYEAYQYALDFGGFSDFNHMITNSTSPNLVYSPIANVNCRALASNAAYTGSVVDRLFTNRTFYNNDYENFKLTMGVNFPLNSNIGKIAGVVGNYEGNLLFKAASDDNSPVQSVFGHSDLSTTPFYNSNTRQQGLGRVNVESETWNNDHPTYYKIDIENTGLEGVSTYSLRKSHSYGFEGNTFKYEEAPLPWVHYANSAQYDGFRIFDEASQAFPVNHGNNHIVFFQKNKVCLINAITGYGKTLDNNTVLEDELNPRFLASDIAQVEVDELKNTFVACRVRGLYKINSLFNNFELIDNSVSGLEGVIGCYGVCPGKDGKIWAYFSHATSDGIYYSLDKGDTWIKTAFSENYLMNNRGKLAYLHADTSKDHVAIFYSVNKEIEESDFYISCVWWNEETDTLGYGLAGGYVRVQRTSSYGYFIAPGNKFGFQRVITCSPKDSHWVGADMTSKKPLELEFGSDVYVTHNQDKYETYITKWVTCDDGKDYLLYKEASAFNYSPNLCLYNLKTGYLERYLDVDNNISNSYACEYLGSGVFFEATYSPNNVYTSSADFKVLQVMHLNENDYPRFYNTFFPRYGWNGSEWELGHQGTKPTHSTLEPIIDGLSISFDDNNGDSLFYETDYYTVGVVDGIWLDGFTTFDYYFELYNRSSYFSSDLESNVLPSTLKVPNVLAATEYASINDYVDTESVEIPSSGQVVATGTSLAGNFDSGLRSSAKVISGAISPFIPFAVFVPETEINNAQGYVEFEIKNLSLGQGLDHNYAVGLSNADVFGNPLNKDLIMYSLLISSETNTDKSVVKVSVVEEGNEKTTPIDIPLNDTKFRIVLRNDGRVTYLYKKPSFAWNVLYESPVGSSAVEDLYFDMNFVAVDNNGLQNLSFHGLPENGQDYYLYLGNGTDKGIFDPDFMRIDPDSLKVKIDGQEAFGAQLSLSEGALPANTYSLFPEEGVIRYSSEDVNKSIEAEFVVILEK